MLTGGAGSDNFVLSSLGADRDSFTDFVSGLDFLQVSAGELGGMLMAGADATGYFVLGRKAVEAVSTFLYDQLTGKLLFDVDGNVAGAAVLVAFLDDHASLVASDFHIIA